MTKEAWDRFLSKVQFLENGCWSWTGYIGPNGYGQVRVDGKSHRVHRLAYAQTNGEIEEGNDVHHVCQNRACVNPSHLQSVSKKEHIRVSPNHAAHVALTMNQCSKSHLMLGSNIIWTERGARKCRECRNAKNRERRLSRRSTRRSIRLSQKKERCKRGHEMSGENLSLVKRAWGHERRCKQCHRERARGYLSRIHAAR